MFQPYRLDADLGENAANNKVESENSQEITNLSQYMHICLPPLSKYETLHYYLLINYKEVK